MIPNPIGSRRRRSARSILPPEEVFALQVKEAKLPEPEREHRFHPERKWRFDFAWADRKLAVECEGGIWIGGRHTRGAGFSADCAKYNAAALAGWRVLRFPASDINDGTAIGVVRGAFA